MKRILGFNFLVLAGSLPGLSQTTTLTRTANLLNDWSANVANWQVLGLAQLAADDNVYAYSKTLAKFGVLQLQLSNFGFVIPATATIDSVIIKARRFKKGKGTVKDYMIYLVRQHPVIANNYQSYGPVLSDPNAFPLEETEVQYKQAGGGANGGLGSTPFQWTPEMINHSRFGVRIFSLEPTGGSAQIYYDQVTITVRFTEVAARPTPVTINLQKPLVPIVYPNPFTATAHLQFTAVESGKAAVEIFNLAGARVAFLYSADVVKGAFYMVPVAEGLLSKGIYIYRVNNGSQTYTGRITKLE
jgi:hypothetical protein